MATYTVTRVPTNDDTVSGTWTGTAGSRYTVVNDYPDTEDYLSHGYTSGYITFGYETINNVPPDATNISVSVKYYERKGTGTTCTSAARLVVGGAAYNASTHVVGYTGFELKTDTWATNPKTSSAWTSDDINGVGSNALSKIGWYSTDANPYIYYASMQLEITYDSETGPITLPPLMMMMGVGA